MKSWLLFKEHNRIWGGFFLQALVLSLLGHGVVLGALSSWSEGGLEAVLPAVPLQGRLVAAPPSAPAVAARPAVKPEPVPPAPREVVEVPQPARPQPPAPVAAVPPAPTFVSASSRSAGPVATEADGEAARHVLRVPGNAAPVVARHDPGPDAAGLRQYRLTLAGEARRLRSYPESARRAGLSGTAEVRVTVEAGVAVRRADLTRSSGHALLDRAAVDMLREAASRAAVPDALRGLSFAVLLPVVFEVEE